MVVSMGAMIRGRLGVISSPCRRILPPNILPNSTRDEVPSHRGTSLKFREMGGQEVSSLYAFAVWPAKISVFCTSYCTLHTTWKARGGPQWNPLKGHSNSAGEGRGGGERGGGLSQKHQDIWLTTGICGE